MTEDKTQLGKYRLMDHLGSGAYADVYRAEHTLLGTTVAVKVLKADALTPDGFARFREEARAAASLHHARTAYVTDMDEVEGQFFLVMRYVDGPALDALIRKEGPLPWGKALEIAAQVAEGLDFAHHKGLVHRDVKPGNIIVSAEEGAVLTDFGLVKALEASTHLTRTGLVMGTPAYIPPEVWQGGTAGPPADQYALACVLVEMLTGTPLFDAQTPYAAVAKHAAPPAFPAQWPEGVPPGFELVLSKALAKEPGERFTTCGEFMDTLVRAHTVPVNFSEQPIRIPFNAKASAVPAAVGANGRGASPTGGRSPLQETVVGVGDRMTITLTPGVDLDLLRIPAGEFLMGDGNEQHSVYLDEYWMGKYPVTVAQFRTFVENSGFKPGDPLSLRGKDDHPVVRVNWHEARAFCDWVTGRVRAQGLAPQRIRLPSEAEWEKAARGTDGREYPWGNADPHSGLCNFKNNEGGVTQMGRYSPGGDSPYGCADMAGNVWEWTSSLWKDYPYRVQDGREDPAASGSRVLRGGSFGYLAGSVRCASRYCYLPDLHRSISGFRVCASHQL